MKFQKHLNLKHYFIIVIFTFCRKNTIIVLMSYCHLHVYVVTAFSYAALIWIWVIIHFFQIVLWIDFCLLSQVFCFGPYWSYPILFLTKIRPVLIYCYNWFSNDQRIFKDIAAYLLFIFSNSICSKTIDCI